MLSLLCIVCAVSMSIHSVVEVQVVHSVPFMDVIIEALGDGI